VDIRRDALKGRKRFSVGDCFQLVILFNFMDSLSRHFTLLCFGLYYL